MTRHAPRGIHLVVVSAAALALLAGGAGEAQELRTAFVPPPRTIADVTAILDQEKPDAEKIAKMHSDADAAVPAGLGPAPLITFLEQRARARANLGRVREAVSDMEQAIKAGKGNVEPRVLARLHGLSRLQLWCEA